jgi:hypothetical protein
MKGRLASRAHSFKENLLGAFGHTSPPSPNPNPAQQNRQKIVKKSGGSHSVEAIGTTSGSGVRGLAKKTNSTDNLIEYSAPKSTDTLVREVQFTLRYFEVSFYFFDLLLLIYFKDLIRMIAASLLMYLLMYVHE